MSAQPAVLQVVILRDGLLVGTEVFVPGQYVLGSADYAELKLDDATVDATHANLFFQNGKVAIQDAGSSSGVFVNGHRVNACEVRPVDEIACGPFTLKVRVLAQKPAAKGAPPPEVAALLGGAPKQPKQGSQSGSPSTVVSPRRMAAAPAAPPAPPPAARPAPHLRAVPEPAGETETFELEEAPPTQLAPVPVQHRAPPPPPPAAAKAQPPPKPVPPPAIAPVGRGNVPSKANVEAMEVPTSVQRPSAKHAASSAHARKRSHPSLAARGDGKGAPRLFFELFWGETREAACSFGTIKPKKPVIGALDEKAQVPLWGFNVPSKGFVIAEQKSAGYRVYVPAGAAVEKRGDDGNFYPLQPDALEASGTKKYLTLTDGQAVRMSGDGDMSLVAYVQPPIPKPFVNPLKDIPYLALFFLALFGGAFGFFVITHPPSDGPDFQGKDVPPVAVRLIAPKPEEKKKIEKKIEKMKEKPEKKVEKTPKKEVEQPKVVAKAEVKKTFKAIEKISAAGPAMKDILAAVDKLGNGPGKKDAKDYKLSGLIGKAPIANAGLGTFGLGGGGAGGFGTKGLEVLRGKGGGGIGALGAGNIGKGAVGGTVTHATARAISAQGTIDKEAVAKVVNSHLQEVRACYERALLKDPGLAGKIVLEWGISTSGTVTSAKTKSSTMKNASVEGCIMTSLKTWKFPPAKGGNVVISYPFMFNSVGY